MAVSRSHIGIAFWDRKDWTKPVGPVRSIRTLIEQESDEILEDLHSSAFGRLPLISITALHPPYLDDFLWGKICGWAWYNQTEIKHKTWKGQRRIHDARQEVVRVLGCRACEIPYNEFRGVLWKAVGFGLHLKGFM